MPAAVPSVLHRIGREAPAGAAVLGTLALAIALASLWPALDIPAWPAGTLALLALAVAWLPGRVLPKAFGTLTATFALVLVSAEITALWAVSAAIPLGS
jgi:hypothetical protein